MSGIDCLIFCTFSLMVVSEVGIVNVCKFISSFEGWL